MTPNPTIVNTVFDGASAAITGGKAIADAIFTTANAIDSVTQSQYNGNSLYSRRDAPCPQQAPAQYQPSTYPWASQTYTGYGFGQQGQMINGYNGITNPNYGHTGFYTGGTWSTTMSTNRPNGSAWFDQGVWG